MPHFDCKSIKCDTLVIAVLEQPQLLKSGLERARGPLSYGDAQCQSLTAREGGALHFHKEAMGGGYV